MEGNFGVIPINNSNRDDDLEVYWLQNATRFAHEDLNMYRITINDFLNRLNHPLIPKNVPRRTETGTESNWYNLIESKEEKLSFYGIKIN